MSKVKSISRSLLTQYFIAKKENSELKEKNKKLFRVIAEVLKVASDHDTGERTYKMTDWDYVIKRCQEGIMENE